MPIGTPELMIVLVIIVVVFGSTKLPQLGDGLGRAIKNFKRAVTNPSEIDVTPKKADAREIPPEAPTATADASTDKAAKDKRATNG
jgi:sec-independent protein translocase protein TatA